MIENGHLPKLRTFGEKYWGLWSYLKITISTKSLASIPFKEKKANN